MDFDLNHLIVFKKVADLGSFTRAAEQLKLPKSSVSQKISMLESQLGSILMHRTTRNLRLTEAGEQVYEIASTMAAGAEEILAFADAHVDAVTGLLRVSAPLDLGIFVLDRAVPLLHERYPQLEIEMDVSNRFVDLVSEGFDLALRVSDAGLKDSSLVCQKIGSTVLSVFAAPDLLKKMGHPQQFEDLAKVKHVWFGGSSRRRPQPWVLTNGRSEVSIPINAVVRTNDFVAATQAIVSGIGIGVLPRIACRKELEQGKLMPIFPEWYVSKPNFFAVYPSRKFLPAKLRVFVEAVVEALGAA